MKMPIWSTNWRLRSKRYGSANSKWQASEGNRSKDEIRRKLSSLNRFIVKPYYENREEEASEKFCVHQTVLATYQKAELVFRDKNEENEILVKGLEGVHQHAKNFGKILIK